MLDGSQEGLQRLQPLLLLLLLTRERGLLASIDILLLVNQLFLLALVLLFATPIIMESLVILKSPLLVLLLMPPLFDVELRNHLDQAVAANLIWPTSHPHLLQLWKSDHWHRV